MKRALEILGQIHRDVRNDGSFGKGFSTADELVEYNEYLKDQLKEILAAQWTKVKDGLPEEGANYRVWWHGEWHAKYIKGEWYARETNTTRYTRKLGNVTHFLIVTPPEEGVSETRT